jgi:hypothetical protein
VFLARSVDAEVLGVRVKIACLEDITQGKLCAYPAELREQIDLG